jgi:hypothetical protein
MQIAMCGRIHHKALKKLKKDGIDWMAYAVSSMDVALFIMRCMAGDGEEFKREALEVLAERVDTVNKSYEKGGGEFETN